MALTAPSAVLTGSTIASSFDQLLFLDAASGMTEATLKIVSTEAGKSALQISDEHVLIKGIDTSNAAAFAVHTTGGALIFGVAADTPAVTVGVDDTGADVRVYSATTNEGLLYDASEDELGLLLTTKLKFYDIGGGEEIYASANGHLEVNSGTTLDCTAPTIDLNASTAVTVDTPAVTVTDTTTSSATEGGFLRLASNDGAVMASGHRLGVIEFGGAEDTSSTITVGARIEAITDATWSASENGAYLSFYTTDGNAAQTEMMRIDNASRISLSNNDSGSANTVLGYLAGAAIASSTDNNVLIGHSAGNDLNAGDQNVIIGHLAGDALTSGEDNVFVGQAAGGASTAGNQMTIIGRNAGIADLTTAAVGSVLVGKDSGGSLTSGIGNTALGYQAMYANATSDYNTAVGDNCLVAVNSDGNGSNTAVGWHAGLSVAGGTDNTIIGATAGDALSTGGSNVLIGMNAGGNFDAEDHNVAIGRSAFGGASSAAYCVAVGGTALQGAATQNGTVAVGYTALNALTSGIGNLAIGYQAMSVHTTGNRNIAIGFQAMLDTNDHADVLASNDNIFIGYQSGGGAWENNDCNANVAVGNYTLDAVMDGAQNNVAVGQQAGAAITLGGRNVMVGTGAGELITAGDECVSIGYDSDCAADIQRAIAIGPFAIASATDSICIGNNTNNGTTRTVKFGDAGNSVKSADWDSSGTIAWTGTSDVRKKRNIKDTTLGLEFINELRPVTFQWKPQNEVPKEWQHYSETNSWDIEKVHHGFIAQEVKEVLDKYDAPDSVAGWNKDRDGMERLGESKLITPLIKAFQELSAKNDALEAKVKALEDAQ